MADDALHTYLSDHMAGSVAAVDILERLIETTGDPRDREFFTGVLAEIQEDRSTLESLLERSGGERGIIREAGAWAAEKLLRVKLRFDDPDGRLLDRLEALEVLALGILGKRALWEALAEVAGEIQLAGTVDFVQLEKRARDQHDRVNAKRLETARLVFRRAPQPASSRQG